MGPAGAPHDERTGEPVIAVRAVGITAGPEGPPRAEVASKCTDLLGIKAQTAQVAQAAQAAQAAQGPRDLEISQRISRHADTAGPEGAPRKAQPRASRPGDVVGLEGAPPRGGQPHSCRPSDTAALPAQGASNERADTAAKAAASKAAAASSAAVRAGRADAGRLWMGGPSGPEGAPWAQGQAMSEPASSPS